MTPSGIEPATFRFVVQHLNHCATAVPNAHVLNTNHEMYCLPGSPTFLYGDNNDSDSNEDGYAAPQICVCVCACACVHSRALILETRVHKTKHCCSRWKKPYRLQTPGKFSFISPLSKIDITRIIIFASMGQGLLTIEDSRSHTDTLQSALLL